MAISVGVGVKHKVEEAIRSRSGFGWFILERLNHSISESKMSFLEAWGSQFDKAPRN